MTSNNSSGSPTPRRSYEVYSTRGGKNEPTSETHHRHHDEDDVDDVVTQDHGECEPRRSSRGHIAPFEDNSASPSVLRKDSQQRQRQETRDSVECIRVAPDKNSATATADSSSPVFGGGANNLEHQQQQQRKQHSNKELASPQFLREYVRYGGRNFVCCHNGLVVGPDMHKLVVSVVLITLPFLVVMSVNDMRCEIPLWFLIPLIVCYVLTMLFLFLAAFVDPGIVPRRKDFVDVPVTVGTTVPSTGESTVVRFCYTCNTYRGPRTHHCNRCNNCVDVMDHHCQWTGTCVGARNYHVFLYFIHSLFILTWLVVAMCVVVPVRVSQEQRIPMWDAMGKLRYLPVVLLPYIFVLTFPVGMLVIYHHYLIFNGVTTAEHLKGSFAIDVEGKPCKPAEAVGVRSPYDKGCCWNYGRFLGIYDATLCSMNYAHLVEKNKRVIRTPLFGPSSTTNPPC